MSSILIHGLFHHTGYSRLLLLLIYNLPLQEQDTWFNTLTCYLICSFTECIYGCFRIINPYPNGKEHYYRSTMLMCSSFCFWFYRFHLFPKLLRSAPSPLPFNEVFSNISKKVRGFCEFYPGISLTPQWFLELVYINALSFCCKVL